MSFESAFQETIGLEGGFDDDPNDPGNWTGGKVGVGILKGTKHGICAAQYPDVDIESLTEYQAKEIYRRDYWLGMKLDQVPARAIHEEIFDSGVNCGPPTAILIAQRALNFLGEHLFEDGIIGPVTLSALNTWAVRDEEALFKALNGFQFIRYLEIVTTNHDHRFARGWMKRIQAYKG